MAKNNNFAKVEEFKKKIQLFEKLDLDDRDNTILSLIQKNPEISQDEIARHIRLSQPSVGARLKKLRQKGILHSINGVNFRVVDLKLAKVDVNAKDTQGVIDIFKDCPFFLNAMVTSGKYNICLLFMATSLKRLEGIVNHHLRNNDQVKDLELNVVITTAKDFVLPLNIDFENKNQLNCGQECHDCIHPIEQM